MTNEVNFFHQGTIVDRIDYNIQTVAVSVDEGLKQLQKVLSLTLSLSLSFTHTHEHARTHINQASFYNMGSAEVNVCGVH